MRVGRCGERHPPVGTGARVYTTRRIFLERIPRALLDSTIDGVVEDSRSDEVDGALSLRQIDVLATAGTPAMVNGCQQSRDYKLRRDIVRIGKEGGRRGPVGPAG